jgi:hypothetical protein
MTLNLQERHLIRKMAKLTKEQLVRIDWHSWMKYCAYLPSKERYGFKGYEYLEAITQRPWKPGDELFLEKSAQCGASELAISWQLWMAERKLPGFKGMGYVFPAMTQLQDHIKARVAPILEVDRFRYKVQNANLRYIRYNNIPWYFRSGNSRALKSWPADAIVIDEFDEFEDPISIVPTIEARLNASDYKWVFGLSTPTHPDIGIDKAIAMCNQHQWYVICDHCKHEFSPLNEVKIAGFENCVDRFPGKQTAGFVCPNCRELTITTGASGTWRLDSEKGNQKYSYSISRLFLANASLGELLDKYEEALNLQEFYNSDLGLPYSPPNSRLQRSDLTDLANGDVELARSSAKSTWAGVDVGKECHYAIGLGVENGTRKVIAYGKCKFEELPRILELYSVKYSVIDLRPYELEVKKVIRGHRTYYACDFNTGNQQDWYTITRADTETSDKSVKIVKADRTQSCDNLIEFIAARKKYMFPGGIKGDKDFIGQMCSVMRVDKVNKETSEVKGLYKSTSKKDHYFFAMAYLNLAFNLKKSSFAKLGGLFF